MLPLVLLVRAILVWLAALGFELGGWNEEVA